MPKKFMKGTGITAREMIRWSMKEPGAADALKAFLGRWNKTHATNDFERRIHRAEAWAKSILGDTSEETAFPDDSQEDFAKRIFTEIRFARKFIEEGDAAAASRFAVDVGYLIAQAEIKFGEPRWEDHALNGEKSATAYTLRDDHADKENFKELVRRLYDERKPQPRTLPEWMGIPEVARYARKYKGRNTLRNWINEAIPGALKSGRPRKHTVIG